MVVGGCGWCWLNYGWSWTVVGYGGKILVCCAWLWMVVGGAVQIMAGRGWYGWSFNIAYFYGKSKKLHSFLNSKCVTRENILSSKKSKYSGLDW